MTVTNREVFEDTEIDYSDLEAKYTVEDDASLDTVLIIDHLPKVDRSKEEKLLAVIRKNVFLPAKGQIVPGSLYMPRDPETDISKGYLFVEFQDAEQASAVLQVANGYRLDKQHVLSAVRLADFDRLLELDDEYKEPAIEPYQEREYLKSWVSDVNARDQFVTLAGTTVSVFWNARSGTQPELVQSRSNWTDSYVQWSPQGSYLLTVHGPGVMLWGGSSFARLGKFPHSNVRLAGFSNTEAYMVTWSPHDPARPTEANLLVWDVSAGKLLRGFAVAETEPAINSPTGAATPAAPTVTWPIIKFSFDDKYAARVQGNVLYVYKVPEFTLLDKKSQTIEGLRDFSWSPVDHSLVHWTSGSEDIPSRVSLVAIPSRVIKRTKNLFNVNTCQVHWQSRGDYLCVQVERHSRNKKIVFSNLELFRLREKEVPIDCLEFKEPISTFVWEPEGNKFLTAGTHEFKTTITFYDMKSQENGIPTVKTLGSLQRKPLSRFLWSPRGEFLLFVGTDSNTVAIEFFSLSEMSVIASREHFLATDIAWDPSGRFVASWVSAWKQSSDHGFVIWDVRGEQICRLNAARMSYFAWRPRPPTLLSREKMQEIGKNLKNYSSAFEEADLQELSRESSNTAEMKGRMMMVWNEWRRHCRREYETRNAARKALIGREHAFSTDSQRTTVLEEWIEEVIEETEELIT